MSCPAATPQEKVAEKYGSKAIGECEYYHPNEWRENAIWTKFPTSKELQRDIETQLSWLQNEMSNSSKNDWNIVVGHHPIFSSSTRGSSPVLGEDLLPILKDRVTQFLVFVHS